ncbi:MAG TPA: xanthine dehydrogenase family protein molybdopterin-binding subunit [Steroidobacteraceae bacterium]|nr:xanthine dehydrogenase family protein molybdopterin-binding subunit [Steroidobacteraceae bacterium]
MHIARRHFLIGTAGAAGALIVGWLAAPPRQRLRPAHALPVSPGQTALNGWVKVGSDGSVVVMMSQAEMGQGAHTGLAMLLAEEMDAVWESVRLEQAPLDPIYNNQAVIIESMFDPDDHRVFARTARHVARRILREIPNLTGTGGSSSVRDQWLPLREAGAAARLMLIGAAAQSWSVPAGECHAAAGRVLHVSGRSAGYGELAARAARQPLPRTLTLKSPSQFTLIGRPLRRLDNAPKLDGSASFAIDALPPGLLYASLTMCPTVGGRVVRFDAAPALALPGVRKVVALDPVKGGVGGSGMTAGGVAVIADTPFHAMQALELVRIDWDHGSSSGLSSQKIFEDLTEALDAHEGHAHLEKGDVTAALGRAAKTIRAEYRVPFLAHATMEPMNATVQFRDGAATVWAATQAAGFAREAVAGELGIPASKVAIRVPFLGGGFGRRYLSDCLQQAARLARETEGAPLQLIWSREQDIAHDYFRPAFQARCQAGLDAAGNLTAWKMTTAGSSLGAPSFADSSSDGAANTAYQFPNARVAHQSVESPVSMGIWRSVSHSQNAFFVESFLDEVAAAAGQDPFAYRERLLEGNARHLRVLARLRELSGWTTPPPAGPDGARRARGLALHRSFGSIVGQVAEVSTAGREIRVHRVACVIDCGVAVNPNLIRQQIEGAIVYGLSAALHGEITLEDGRVRQSNFHDYVPLRMFECPDIVTEIIADAAVPGGVGETGTPPIAPAVANAVFALTGQRLRTLPLKPV